MFVDVAPGGRPFIRLFDALSPHKPAELTFRNFGPLFRFDHHRPAADHTARVDSDRGVWYGGHRDFACAVVEVFGDDRVVILEGWKVSCPLVNEPLRLLDLRYNGAMRAGTVAELAKTGRTELTWEWSRYFYENSSIYGEIDGLSWLGAHNDGDCAVLFERSESKLTCDACSVDLADPRLRDAVLGVVKDHNLGLAVKRS